MLKFFKSLVVPEEKASTRKQPLPDHRRLSRAMPLEPEPLLMVEVTEGNDDKDWDLWQDSVSLMDSQMQSLLPLAGTGEQWQASHKDADPYSGVRKRDR